MTDLPELVGLEESEAVERARAAGRSARVVSRDGEALVVTMDHRPDRINLVLDGGRVVSTRPG